MRKKPRRRVFALLPIYNEAATLGEILPRVSRNADRLVLVDDGCTDASPRLLDDFARRRAGTYVLHLPGNRGMAGALLAGFRFVMHLSEVGEASLDDVLVTMDADGQHQPEYLPEGARRLVEGGLDVLLTKRDFRVYPLYKIVGNRFLTAINRVLSGHPYQDVESGMRFIRIGALPSILRYYLGRGYSCAQEIALLSARQGLRVSNDFNVDVPLYRAGTDVWDGFVVLFHALGAWVRWWMDWPTAKADEGTLFPDALIASRRRWPRGRRR